MAVPREDETAAARGHRQTHTRTRKQTRIPVVFEETFKEQVRKQYRPLVEQYPEIFEYAETLSRLTKIFALPYRLAKWTETHDVSHLQRALADCESILLDHERYPVLFGSRKYFDARGFEHEPTFGRWSHDGQVHYLLDLIEKVKKLTSSLVEDQ
jgi:hypothetical protein